jgi:hypothetical protein
MYRRQLQFAVATNIVVANYNFLAIFNYMADERLDKLFWQQPSPLNKGFDADFLSQDGKIVVEVKSDPKGLRRFHEGILQLARCLLHRPEVKRGYLMIVSPRVSRDRLRKAWEETKDVFAPEISQRLAIAAVDREGQWIEPADGPVRPIKELLESQSLGQLAVSAKPEVAKPFARQKHLELLKVLLNRWILREGAISVGELTAQVGCVYPTAAQALKRLDERNYLLRRSNRSVELRRFPEKLWKELLVLSDTWRQPLRYADASGKRPDFPYLLRRLTRMKPPHMALGGVAAARYWHADFDLHGIPRIDLSVHVLQGRMDLDFMQKLDPALEPVDRDDRSAAVVLHPLFRREPLYAIATESELPYADAVETVLDLHEMGLTAQAGALLNHFRPELRLS